jgi:hypothetical protein
MGVLGKKYSNFVQKIGGKIHVNDIKKIGNKALSEAKHFGGQALEELEDAKKIGKTALKGVNKGLEVSHKVIGVVEKGLRKGEKIAGKLEGVPVIGEFAGVASSAMKQVGTGVKYADKGVKGLEKSVQSVEDLGKRIGKSKKKFLSKNDDEIVSAVKDIAEGVQGLRNPLKK